MSLYVPQARAGELVMPLMPAPGTMVALSSVFRPAHLEGLTIHPDDALKFDFLIHKGEGNLDTTQKREEYSKLVKYFLASLTIPDGDQWVNLSPYEQGRVIELNFGKTEMGRDLLSQDYLLKQITSSLMYPESGLGKKFWDRVYARARELGNVNIPVNTFNKVWITPDAADVYESGNTVYILRSHLKVMLEEDYLSLEKHAASAQSSPSHTLTSKVVREIILPEIEREVNEGKNFAILRQIYSGMILAAWYKKTLKGSLLGKVYADKAKVKGVDQDPKANEAIYQQYLAAFKKGVYNYIKEDLDPATNQLIPRKYFAGGFVDATPKVLKVYTRQNPPDPAMTVSIQRDFAQTAVDRAAVALGEGEATDQAMTTAGRVAMILGAMVLFSIGHSIWTTPEKKSPVITSVTNFRDPVNISSEVDRGGKIRAYIFTGNVDDLTQSDVGQTRMGQLLLRLLAMRREVSIAEGPGEPAFVTALARAVEQRTAVLTRDGPRYTIRVPADNAMASDAAMLTRRALLGTAVTGIMVGLLPGIGASQEAEPLDLDAFTTENPVQFELEGSGRTKTSAIQEIMRDPRGTSSNSHTFGNGRELKVGDKVIVSYGRFGIEVRVTGTVRAIMKFEGKGTAGNTYLYVDPTQIDRDLDGRHIIIRDGPAINSIYEVVIKPTPVAQLGNGSRDAAMAARPEDVGGIDFNAANLNLRIKRNGKGVPLPLTQQDMAQLGRIEGFIPTILEIRPALEAPVFPALRIN